MNNILRNSNKIMSVFIIVKKKDHMKINWLWNVIEENILDIPKIYSEWFVLNCFWYYISCLNYILSIRCIFGNQLSIHTETWYRTWILSMNIRSYSFYLHSFMNNSMFYRNAGLRSKLMQPPLVRMSVQLTHIFRRYLKEISE